MNNLETEYRVNEQGMIVEVMGASEANESEHRSNLQDAESNAIPEDVVHQS